VSSLGRIRPPAKFADIHTVAALVAIIFAFIDIQILWRKFQKTTTFQPEIRKTTGIRSNCKKPPLLQKFVAMYTDS
jgi:hypothetical protein